MIKTLTIDRKKWGVGNEGGYLLNPQTNKQCCLGFFAKKCGFRARDILDRNEPKDLLNIPEQYIPNRRKKLAQLLKKDKNFENHITNTLMEVNDDISFDERSREQKIASLFLKLGVKVKFIN